MRGRRVAGAYGLDKPVDVCLSVEHTERYADAVAFGRNPDAVLREVVQPVGRRQRDDVDVRRAMLPVARTDQADTKSIESFDQIVATAALLHTKR